MKTHIETLGDSSPKSRRRVRRLLNLPPTVPVGALQSTMAQDKALARELIAAKLAAIAKAKGEAP